MTLGKYIKEARIKKSISQKDLAKSCDVFQKTISEYENDIVVPSAITLKKIADALNTTTDYLLGGSPFPELNNPEFVIVLNEIDQLPKKEKEALLTTLNTFLSAYNKVKKNKIRGL